MSELLELEFSNYIWVFLLPLMLMALDVITGYYNAWKNHQIKSQKMRDGIGKKIAEIVYIVVGFFFNMAFNFPALMYFIAIYIIYMEVVSIAENCDKLGVHFPEEISKRLNNDSEKEKINKSFKN